MKSFQFYHKKNEYINNLDFIIEPEHSLVKFVFYFGKNWIKLNFCIHIYCAIINNINEG